MLLGLEVGKHRAAIVDHVNGDGLDNRRSNLRIVSSTQNRWNAKVRSDCRSGLRGVRQQQGRWIARILVDGRRRSLGSFSTAEEAAAAYDAAASKFFGVMARLNNVAT